MSSIEVGGKSVEVDEEGYLVDIVSGHQKSAHTWLISTTVN